MATFTGGAGSDTIVPGSVSGGVTASPVGATPGGENDFIDAGLGNDSLGGGNGNDTIFAGDGNDALDGGSGDDSLDGSGGNDNIAGGLGNDVLTGGIGNDTYRFTVNAGVDTVTEFTASGTDIIRIEGTVNPASVTYQVVGANLVISRGTGLQITILDQYATGTGSSARVERVEFDDLTEVDIRTPLPAWLLRSGTDESESLLGSAFNDTIDGRGGDDTVNGGNGVDNLEGGGGGDAITGDAGSDTLLGEGGNDSLDGGLDDDSLDGGAGSDSILGGTGNDRLIGGGGNDELAGGIGNDSYRYSGPFGDDLITEAVNAGKDTIAFLDATVLANLTFSVIGTDLIVDVAGGSSIRILGQFASGTGALARVETITFATGGKFDIRALDPAWRVRTDGPDTLIGTAANDTLVALDGADSISGLDGNDSLQGDAGNDTLLGGLGNDTLNGGAGADSMSGGIGNDTYVFADFQGADIARELVSEGTDTILFGPGITVADFDLQVIGDDLLIVGAGGTINVLDQFQTGSGSSARIERIRLDDGTVIAIDDVEPEFLNRQGTASNDSLNGSIFNDTLDAGDGNDTLTGQGGDDVLTGGDGNDNINGGLGNDTLEGGVGNDIVAGGGDQNAFVFQPGDGNDTVNGFADGFDTLLFGNFGPAYNTDAEIIAAATQVFSVVRITLNNPDGVGQTIVNISNFTLAQLDASDIDFL